MEEKRKPILNNTLKLFLLAMILANIAGNMYLGLMPLYLKNLNASVAQVGLFFTLSSIIPLALQILGGWVSDSLGRLRSIAIGSVSGILSYVAFLLAPTWQWVLLGEGIGAMTRSLVAPSFGAFIAEQSSEDNRARVFGVTDTLYSIVAIVGPPLGGWLVEAYGYRVMFLTAGALYTIATIIRVFMARRAAQAPAAGSRAELSWAGLKSNLGGMLALALAGGVITWLILTDGVRDVAFALSYNLMPIYMEDVGRVGVQQIGWLGSGFGLASLLFTYPGGWLADKKGERTAIALGYLLNFAALAVFLSTNTFWGFLLSWVVFGAGSGLMGPAYSALITKAIPEKLRGTGFGLLNTSLGLFSLPAPAIGAQLYERVSIRLPFQITMFAALFTVIPVWRKFRLSKPAAPVEAAEALSASD